MIVDYASQIVIDNSRLMLEIVASLTDDSRGVIYNHNMFIVQATGAETTNLCITIINILVYYLLATLESTQVEPLFG